MTIADHIVGAVLHGHPTADRAVNQFAVSEDDAIPQSEIVPLPASKIGGGAGAVHPVSRVMHSPCVIAGHVIRHVVIAEVVERLQQLCGIEVLASRFVRERFVVDVSWQIGGA